MGYGVRGGWGGVSRTPPIGTRVFGEGGGGECCTPPNTAAAASARGCAVARGRLRRELNAIPVVGIDV